MLDLDRIRAETPGTRRGAYAAAAQESPRLDAEARALPTLVRASPHYYNDEDEIDRLLAFCADL